MGHFGAELHFVLIPNTVQCKILTQTFGHKWFSEVALSYCHTRRHCARQWPRHSIRSVAGYIEIHGSVNREAVPRSLPQSLLRSWQRQ